MKMQSKGRIYRVSTKGMTPEQWLAYRSKGIGASEIGTLMGLNPYKSQAHLFYEKIGEVFQVKAPSFPAFLGTIQEPLLAKMWQHWDPNSPTEATMMENYEQKRFMRKCQRVNAYMHNTDYPHLFVSIDYSIVPTTSAKYIMRVDKWGILELKTIGGYEADKWESGIPPGYVAQVNQQMMVANLEYGEIPIQQDNRSYFVYPFERNQSICEGIVELSTPFWESVVKAREFKEKELLYINQGELSAAEDMRGEIQLLEPGPENTDAYTAFLKEKYRIAEPGVLKGNYDLLDIGYKHQDAKGRKKELNTELQGYENQLKNFLGQNKGEKIDFGKAGYISWKADSDGTRKLLNKLKPLEGGELPDLDEENPTNDGTFNC